MHTPPNYSILMTEKRYLDTKQAKFLVCVRQSYKIYKGGKK